ncbi:DNA topoisomerase IB [Stenotrophomonas terrae]|uniref:DNA topoisomerase IB n=1 Tax=Stenotrophomonas terrae TaxID=405446 RepID=UPI00320B7C6E
MAAKPATPALRHSHDAEPGIVRQRAGRGFRYVDARGKPVRAAATLERIRRLAIPPAYTQVWICAQANGHLQASGRDARGRKQYRYHPQWVRMRSDSKFDRIVAFGKALPGLRRQVRTDLALSGLPRSKVLAIVVAVMGRTLARIGNDAYARDNHSYGLTTLRNRHLESAGQGQTRLRFRGKSGQAQAMVIDDRHLSSLVRRCQQLPGQLLFQYRDDDGKVRPVGSNDVNAYLRQATGDDFSAKDFRTWGGTLVALRELAQLPLPDTGGERALAEMQNQVIAAVAGMLGNTPAVCRKSYIDPCVFEGWRDGRLGAMQSLRGPRQWEAAALRFLRSAHRGNGALSRSASQ